MIRTNILSPLAFESHRGSQFRVLEKAKFIL